MVKLNCEKDARKIELEKLKALFVIDLEGIIYSD